MRQVFGVRAWIKRKVAALDRAARPWTARGPLHAGAYEALILGLKQVWCCLFGGVMLSLILATHLYWPGHSLLARYDFLVLAAIFTQAWLLILKLEHWDEAAMILVYHVVGTAMEVFKTAHGSWIYPEPSLLRIGGVPLFTGFMYAAIGSYIARCWRMFDFRFDRYPPVWTTWVLAVGAYINFFSHHYLPDIRIGLFAAAALLFGRTRLWFTIDRQARSMPLLAGLILVAMLIWIAENAGSFAGAWMYPAQIDGWRMVPLTKLGAWFLLMLLSFVLVSAVRPPREPDVATSDYRSPGTAVADPYRS